MKPRKKGILFCIASALIMGSPSLYASQPVFSIIPASGSVTSILLPGNFTDTVSYEITNNTKNMRTLTMVPITGVTQTTLALTHLAGGICGKPFTLAPNQSCTLNLSINGSLVPSSGINGGPVICKTMAANNNSPDMSLCAQPSKADTLAISTTLTGQHAYVANQIGSSVSLCQVDPVTGLLSKCHVSATGTSGVESVNYNPAGTLLYTANLAASTVSVCHINQSTGELSGCVDSGGTGFNQPDGIVFSPDGTIFYTSNVGNSVTSCLVNSTTGLLSNCINNTSPTFLGSSDMALNTAGTLAYVSNRFASTVSVCNVSGQTLSSCNNLSGSNIDAPEGMSLNPQGTHAYIANAGSDNVTVCDVLQDGTGLLANCSITNGQFVGTGNVAFNTLGTVAYVPNQVLGTVFTCQVSLADGTFSVCLPSLLTGFVGPSGIVLK